MMHLTLTNMTIEQIDGAIEEAKEKGIKNILALRGDPPRGQEAWRPPEGGLHYAKDLVRHIKEKYGDYFGIAVAGYPEGHVDATSKEDDLTHLKEKVDAGADLIITQLFYDDDVFIEFYHKCREIGINCPIIPGIMPIQSYQGFHRMTSFCKTKVPQQILDDLEAVKEDEDEVKKYGISLAIKTCKKLAEHGIEGFHFYTLNLERSVIAIINELGLVEPEREAPWRKVAGRRDEGVRPINWGNRPKSYIERTLAWDDYPNWRWGDARSPAFGAPHPLSTRNYTNAQIKDLRKKWGSPETEEDVKNVFVRFLQGEINRLPWLEEELEKETMLIQNLLVEMNNHNLLTITSQPQVNGVLSTDPRVGWGPKTQKLNGYVYQRAFIEFFCPPSFVDMIISVLDNHSSVSYMAANIAGDFKTNMEEGTVIAATWGVFPNREILQPTIVDREVFYKWWRQEAFAVWLEEWAVIYEDESPSKQLLKSIHDSYYLFNVIENDYIGGNIDSLFEEVLQALPSRN
mmetsp:Transcript_8578/g.8533  ORF Transcript_8578/g.8533 Transcript_8578/m.8533 type:complete len:515 (+) Transcript_8578:232-1776(+)